MATNAAAAAVGEAAAAAEPPPQEAGTSALPQFSPALTDIDTSKYEEQLQAKAERVRCAKRARACSAPLKPRASERARAGAQAASALAAVGCLCAMRTHVCLPSLPPSRCNQRRLAALLPRRPNPAPLHPPPPLRRLFAQFNPPELELFRSRPSHYRMR